MKYGIIYGGLIGLSFFATSVINHYTDIAAIKFLSILLFLASIILFVVLGLKAVKKKQYNNSINYAQCIFNGFYIAGFAGISCAIATFIYLSTIDVDFKKRNLENYRQQLILAKTPEKEMASILKTEEENQTIQKASGMGFVLYSFATIIVVVIASSFIRNKDTFNITPTAPTAEPKS